MPKTSKILIHDLREVLWKVPLQCRTYLCRNAGSDASQSEDMQGTAIASLVTSFVRSGK
jgi:hypothetical protein